MASIKAAKIRPARKREELNDPNKPASHSANQIQPLFAARVEPEIKERIDKWIERNNVTKRQATELAFELLFEHSKELGLRPG